MPHSTFQESLLQGLHELSSLDSWIRLLGMAPSAGIMGPDLKMASLGPMGQRGAGPPGEIAQNVLEPVANGQIFACRQVGTETKVDHSSMASCVCIQTAEFQDVLATKRLMHKGTKHV